MIPEFPNDLRLTILRKLGNFKKILLTLGIEEKYPVGHQKSNLNSRARKVKIFSCKTFPSKSFYNDSGLSISRLPFISNTLIFSIYLETLDVELVSNSSKHFHAVATIFFLYRTLYMRVLTFKLATELVTKIQWNHSNSNTQGN